VRVLRAELGRLAARRLTRGLLLLAVLLGAADATVADVRGQRLAFPADAARAVPALAGVLAVLGLVLGLSLLGAEARGGLVAQACWEPRRGRLLTAKLVVAAFGGALVGAAGAGAGLAAWAVVARRHREYAAADRALLAAGGRAVALVAAAALVGLGIAALARTTGTGLALLAALAVMSEAGVRTWWHPGLRWLPGDAARDWLAAGSHRAALVLLAYAALAITAGTVAFHRRDLQ
jgi:hypothetical protein